MESMLKSMTGFGRAGCSKPIAIEVSLQSLNRKFLEIALTLPKEFAPFEMAIRKIISGEVLRGQVQARFSISLTEGELFRAYLKKLKSLKKKWDKLAEEVGCEKEDVDLRFLLSSIESESIESDHYWKPIERCLKQALTSLCEMRVREGELLALDMGKRLKLIETSLSIIEEKAPTLVLKYKSKLEERIKEFCSPGKEEEKILKEIAFFAEKTDITEEIVRLRIHLTQFKKFLKGLEETVGKKLEFIIQEMMREVNTIASKSPEVSPLVIDIKSELEKMKEQVQNVE